MSDSATNKSPADGTDTAVSALDLSKITKPYYANENPAVNVRFRTTHVSRQILPDDPVALKLEVLRLRDELIGALAREGEVRAQLDGIVNSEARRSEHRGLQNHAQILAYNDQLEDQIDAILHSRTWRIGSFLLKPTKPIRKILRKRG